MKVMRSQELNVHQMVPVWFQSCNSCTFKQQISVGMEVVVVVEDLTNVDHGIVVKSGKESCEVRVSDDKILSFPIDRVFS